MESIYFEIMEIAAVLPPAVTPQPPAGHIPAPDAETLKQIFDDLEARLDHGDFSACTLLKEQAVPLRGALGAHYEEFAQQVGHLDFKAALRTLRLSR